MYMWVCSVYMLWNNFSYFPSSSLLPFCSILVQGSKAVSDGCGVLSLSVVVCAIGEVGECYKCYNFLSLFRLKQMLCNMVFFYTFFFVSFSFLELYFCGWLEYYVCMNVSICLYHRRRRAFTISFLHNFLTIIIVFVIFLSQSSFRCRPSNILTPLHHEFYGFNLIKILLILVCTLKIIHSYINVWRRFPMVLTA